MANPTADPAIATHFRVRVDDVDGSYDLGTFISCEGLAMNVETEDRIEGGNNGFVWKLPVRMTYPNVRMTRPVGEDTVKVVKWFASATDGAKRTSARIVALTPDGKDLISWTLTGVVPIQWHGPSFSAETVQVATEMLEIAHHGMTCEVVGKAGG